MSTLQIGLWPLDADGWSHDIMPDVITGPAPADEARQRFDNMSLFEAHNLLGSIDAPQVFLTLDGYDEAGEFRTFAERTLVAVL